MILPALEVTVIRTALEEYLNDAGLAGLDKEYPGAYEAIHNALYKFIELDKEPSDIVVFSKSALPTAVKKN